jgi:hypothetical protein
MIKTVLSTDEGKVMSLASVSLGLSGLQDFLVQVERILHSFISLGQIAVAVFTVIYIWKKTRAIRVKTDREIRIRHKSERTRKQNSVGKKKL